MSARTLFSISAVLAGIGVALGAFGAHGLDGITPRRLDTYKTAALYHMLHALALLVVALAMQAGWDARLRWAAYSFLVGLFLFSGSLYVLVLTDTPWLGAVTPFGGTAFMIGWGFVALFGWKKPQPPQQD
ncbi:MAG: DUF423 domain-containing protein [Bacteroidota bacterium]